MASDQNGCWLGCLVIEMVADLWLLIRMAADWDGWSDFKWVQVILSFW